jgi:thiamine biosynthesis lipoprotein
VGPPYELDGGRQTVRLTRVGARLDLGGIAKGKALDLAAEVLREQGVGCALLHGGTSSVVAIGAPRGCAGWRVALEGGAEAPCVWLADEALAVSCNRGRRNAAGGHILDPQRMAPTTDGAVVAIVAARASTADAWATAICAAGSRVLDLPGGLAALCCEGESRAGARGPWRVLTERVEPFHFPSASSTRGARPA